MVFDNRFGSLKLNLAIASMFVIVSACDEQPTSMVPVYDTKTDGVIAATINGQPIYVSDIQLEAESLEILTPGEVIDPESPEFTRILNSLIDDTLLAQEAEARGLHNDPYLQHRLQVIRNRLLGNMLLDQGVDETAIQKYYETSVNLKQLKLGEEYRIRQIVLKTREAADALRKDLSADTDFAVLASNRSIDESTRMEGGDLGFVNPDHAPPELARAILNTPIEGVSTPFETGQGWHIIKVEEKRPEPLPTLAELRPQIKNFLVAGELERLLKKLHSNAKIIRSFDEVDDPVPDPFSEAQNGQESETPTESGQADALQDREL